MVDKPNTSMRTAIQFQLVCSRCHNVLEADLRESQTLGSASRAAKGKDCISRMAIKPCKYCSKAYEQPLKALKEALGALPNDQD